MTAKKAAAPKKSDTSLAKRVKELEADLALQAWLFEELKHAIRMLLAHSMVANPAVQQQLSAELANRMAQRTGFGMPMPPTPPSSGFIRGSGIPTPPGL